MYKVIDLIKTVDAVCPRAEDVQCVLKRAEEMASACEELLSGAAELKKKHFQNAVHHKSNGINKVTISLS